MKPERLGIESHPLLESNTLYPIVLPIGAIFSKKKFSFLNMIFDVVFHAEFEYDIYFALGLGFSMTSDQLSDVFGLVYDKIKKICCFFTYAAKLVKTKWVLLKPMIWRS